MAIRRTHQPSDLEKRLRQLNQQLYGSKKELRHSASHKQEKGSQEFTIPSTNYHLPTTNSSDLGYLRQDLTKIALLSTLALGVELIIYFSKLYNIVKLPI